jgi:hypothetical protein
VDISCGVCEYPRRTEVPVGRPRLVKVFVPVVPDKIVILTVEQEFETTTGPFDDVAPNETTTFNLQGPRTFKVENVHCGGIIIGITCCATRGNNACVCPI